MKKIAFVSSYHTTDARTGFTAWVLELYTDGKSVTAYPFNSATAAVRAVLKHDLSRVFTENTCGFFEQLAQDEIVWDSDMDRTDDGFTYLTWIELNS